MRISFFNKPTYKRFEMPTRYYDEQKSEFELRMKKWQNQKEEQKGDYNKEEFRDELRRSWSVSRQSKNSFNRRYTNIRRTVILFMIVVILIYVIYYLGNKYLV